MEKRAKLLRKGLSKSDRTKKAQTHTLKLALLVFIFIVTLILLYNIVNPYLVSEREDPWGESRGELATVKPDSSPDNQMLCAILSVPH